MEEIWRFLNIVVSNSVFDWSSSTASRESRPFLSSGSQPPNLGSSFRRFKFRDFSVSTFRFCRFVIFGFSDFLIFQILIFNSDLAHRLMDAHIAQKNLAAHGAALLAKAPHCCTYRPFTPLIF